MKKIRLNVTALANEANIGVTSVYRLMNAGVIPRPDVTMGLRMVYSPTAFQQALQAIQERAQTSMHIRNANTTNTNKKDNS